MGGGTTDVERVIISDSSGHRYKFKIHFHKKLRVAFSCLTRPPLTEVLIPLGQFIANETSSYFVGGIQQLAV